MKIAKKIAVLVSISMAAVAIGGPQDIGVIYPEQVLSEVLPDAVVLCDEQSPAIVEHIVFVGGKAVLVKEILASEIEVLDEGGAEKECCSGFHEPGESERTATITCLISNRRQLEVHQRGIKKRTAGRSLPG